jgi:hypothetical protein
LGAQRGGCAECSTEHDTTRSRRDHGSKGTPSDGEAATNDSLDFFSDLLAESFDIVLCVRDTLDLIGETAQDGELHSKARATNFRSERLTCPR